MASKPPRTAGAASPGPKFVRKTLSTVFIALLIDILAFTIILPLYPRILEHYEAVDGKDESSLYFWMRSQIQTFRLLMGVSGERFDIVLFGGALGSMFSFLQFISSPVIGAVSDRYGRRTVLLISMIGNAVSMLLWIFSASFGWFVCSRIVGGLTEGNVQMSIAVISDITTAETRSKGLALVGIAFSLGFTVGPPLGAYFTSVNLLEAIPFLRGLPVNQYSSPALFAFILILIETAYLFAALPETRDYNKTAAAASRNTSGATTTTESTAAKPSMRDVAVGPTPPSLPPPAPSSPNSRINTLSLLHFLFLFFFSGMEFTLTFLTHDRFGFSHARQGRLLAFVGVLSACVQGGYTRRIAHKVLYERTIVAQGVLAAAIGLAVLGMLAWDVTWLFVGAAFLAFTSGTVVTGLTALASYETGGGGGSGAPVRQNDQEDRRGQVLGRFRSVGQLGRALGPLFACTTYWVLGSRAAYGIGAAAMVCVALATVAFAPAGSNNTQQRPVAQSKKETTQDVSGANGLVAPPEDIPAPPEDVPAPPEDVPGANNEIVTSITVFGGGAKLKTEAIKLFARNGVFCEGQRVGSSTVFKLQGRPEIVSSAIGKLSV
ncbi:hypothetical protein HDU86_004027 [Geranomyces michiganensis]|nr:hypothetical protein HDU86_004027 [Geranomyces michiganensis]